MNYELSPMNDGLSIMSYLLSAKSCELYKA